MEIQANGNQAAIGVIVRDQRFLMITRGETELSPGKICFPGGGVEDNESILQALVRELDEELNVAIHPVRELWRSHSPRGTELHWWLTKLPRDQVIVPHAAEVAAFDWMDVADIVCLPNLLASNALFFEALSNAEFAIN